MYIGLEGPSWLGAMMALVNTATDKQKFCANYGIEISKDEWPSEHLPEVLLADRGELEGFNIERLVDAFNIHVENTAPYRADWKGVVEKHFDLIQKRVKPLLPGYVEKDFQERGSRDYRLDAILTLDDFTKIIIKQILYYNQKHYLKDYIRDEELVRDDISPIPRELWNWGIINRTGRLKYFPEDIVKLNLLPRTTAIVTHKGIRLKGVYYSCDRALKESWFETARKKGSWKVTMAYDSRDMSITYWLNSTTNEFEACRMVEASKRYMNSSLEEINYLIEYEKHMKYDNNHKVLQKDIDYLSEVEDIVQKAKLKKSKSEDKGISKAKKVGSIKEYRKVEREEIRKTEVFEIGDAQKQSETAVTKNINGESMEGYSRPNVREFLKRRKEKNDE
ncbi:Mu transposase C-terminal domain-containing protein [Brevibacillus laterosporus]|uniref:Mu transposase C-terminal domain-containing protein n=1 Tax=Brevibacillus laterosporus TaxID=1465 RepID=UPI0018CC9D15|nr:Mu transposase C-terminal domain-containing protein [Brevibacillus laterosporus]